MNTPSSRRTIIRRAAQAFVFCTSLTLATAALTTASRADDTSDASRFWNAGYNYCDAKLLAGFWHMDTLQAKAMAGAKIRVNGKKSGKKLIAQNLASARTGENPCGFEDSGHTYQEIVELAAYWGIEPIQAKSKVSDMIYNGRRGDLANAWKNAQN
jgi:hypothetical protein